MCTVDRTTLVAVFLDAKLFWSQRFQEKQPGEKNRKFPKKPFAEESQNNKISAYITVQQGLVLVQFVRTVLYESVHEKMVPFHIPYFPRIPSLSQSNC